MIASVPGAGKGAGPDADLPAREERLGRVVAECSDRINAGEDLDIDRIVAAHPDLSPELELALELLGDLERAPPSDSMPGTIGGFRIVREIGRGGMGVVYEAIEEALGRRVALKVLPLRAGIDGVTLERFLREARAAARLHHTHIVPVHAVGEHDGVHFYAMQFIDGCSLDRVIDELRRDAGGDGARAPGSRGPASQLARRIAATLVGPDAGERREEYFRTAACIAADIGDALDHAHGEGVLHRDVKPSNIIVDRRGSVWVADFGLARDVDSAALTQSGDVVGTVAYMAPEWFEGDGDRRSDVYSLGLTLYELITLRPAFHDSDPRRLMRAVVDGSPPRPRRVDPRIPADLETIVLTATAREPERRYATATALADDLRRFAAGQPILARPCGPLERAWLWARRKPLLASLGAVITVLLIVIAMGSAIFAWNLRDRLYRAYVSQARAERLSGRAGRRFEALDAIARAARIRITPELRDEAIASLSLADARPLVEIAADWRDAHRAPDPAIERYAALEPGAPDIVVRRVTDDAELLRLRAGQGATASRCFWSPDGGLLAVVVRRDRDSALRVHDALSGDTVLELPGPVVPEACAFARQGRRVAIASPTGACRVTDVATGVETLRFTVASRPKWLEFSPGDRFIAVLHDLAGDVTVVDGVSGAPVTTIAHARTVSGIAFSPCGRLLASSSFDTHVYLWEVGSWRLARRLDGHRNAVTGVLFAPDGELLVSGGWDSALHLWNPWTGQHLATGAAGYYPLVFDAAGTRLAVSIEKQLSVWEVAPGGACRTFVAPRAYSGFAVSFHPSGRLLAYAVGGLAAGFWDLETRREFRFPFAAQLFFLPGDGGLLTLSEIGPVLWPTELVEEPGGDVLVIGPPSPLDRRRWGGPSALPSGARLALSSGDLPAVLLVELDGVPRGDVLEALPRSAQTTLSGDGRWLAAGTWKGHGVRIWDLATRTVATDLPLGESAVAHFSPVDERLLTIEAGRLALLESGTWRPVHQEDGFFSNAAAFSPDGRFLAVARVTSPLELLDPRTGARLGRLDHGGPSNLLVGLTWTPDSALLAAAYHDATVRLWDMREVRGRLRELGLDWDLPPLPPPGARRPISVRVVGAETLMDEAAEDTGNADGVASDSALSPTALAVRAFEHYSAGRWERAIEDLTRAHRLAPDDPTMLNSLAWVLVAGEPAARDPARALPLIERALELRPGQAELVNTLGVVYYRLDRYQDALDTLLRDPAISGAGVSAHDGYFIAMSLERLGQSAMARYFYHRAVEWSADQPPVDASARQELERFRAEAEMALGLRAPGG